MKSKVVFFSLIILSLSTLTLADAAKFSILSDKFVGYVTVFSSILMIAALILLINLWKFLGDTGLGPSLKIISMAMVLYVLESISSAMLTYGMINMKDMPLLMNILGSILLIIGLYNMLLLKRKPHIEIHSEVHDLLR